MTTFTNFCEAKERKAALNKSLFGLLTNNVFRINQYLSVDENWNKWMHNTSKKYIKTEFDVAVYKNDAIINEAV